MDENNLNPPHDNSPEQDSVPDNITPKHDAPPSSPPVETDDGMGQRLERLGGEPAPVITPEEFARLQKAGQVHIDSRGRVRTELPRGVDPGVSLRKRRAWYGGA